MPSSPPPASPIRSSAPTLGLLLRFLVLGRYLPQIVSSDLAIGDNRFVVRIVDQEENSPVSDAQIRFRFFTLSGDQAALRSEVEGTTLQLTKSCTHTHHNGTVESHEAGAHGVFVANVVFDSSGAWGVDITGTVRGAALESVRQSFDVRERPHPVATGGSQRRPSAF